MSEESGRSKSYKRQDLIPGGISMVEQEQGEFIVTINTYRTGRNTIAMASTALPWGRNGGIKYYKAVGASTLNEQDRDLPSIGTSLAAGRALGKLKSIILQDTMSDVHERCKAHNTADLRYLSDEQLDELRISLTSAVRSEKRRRRTLERERAQRRLKYLNEAQSNG